ncbi:MAG: DoxX family membrane protein [Candidatus Dormibacteraeota bacterium]|nr:DoxX family membrane protein [Candidatus Dormibacteraeota bacterium]
MRVQRAIAVMRIFFGIVYFTNGLSKFVPGIAHLPGNYFLIDSQGALGIIQHNARHHPVTLYHDLVFNVFVPYWGALGPLIGLTEMAAGLLLIFGLASALGALVAALLSLHIQFSDANGPWLYEYAVEWVPLLCLVFMKAGAVWGLDRRFAVANPRWKRAFA